MSRLTSFGKRLLCLLLILALLPVTALAAEDEPPFKLPKPLPGINFTDVARTAWYYDSVRRVCALGLMEGVSGTQFAPDGQVALSQGITVAVRVYEIYHGIEDTSGDYDGPWYAYYLDRAKTYGLLPSSLRYTDVTRAATRAELAAILASVLPEEELQCINPVDYLHDYNEKSLYWDGVITLYRAGVLTGDFPGGFSPNRNIRRSELAAVLVRLVLPEYRVRLAPEGTALGMEAFSLPERLPGIAFDDVSVNHWSYPYVRQAYALGLVSGVSANRFDPNGMVRLNQAVAVAVRIYEKYYGITDGAEGYGGPWYSYYMDKAKTYGILTDYLATLPVEQAVTRAELVAILYGALPKGELPAIKTVGHLPDYDNSDLYWPQAQTFYRAGILTGQDQYGTFCPSSLVRRSELAALLSRLVLPEQRSTEEIGKNTALKSETICYGTSSGGRALNAYRYGEGKNVMVLTFAIHGWEDSFPRDGQLLVHTGNALRSELATNFASLVLSGDWSVYILPCLNPDGLYAGWTHDGPGRCTLASTDENGNRRERGIDMNRSFPYYYSRAWSDRNYNGTAPLQSPEAQALATFTQKVMGQGKNILIDTHGWYQQTIVEGGTSNPIYRAFKTYFPGNVHTYLGGSGGYYSAWAGYTLGYEACLFEFPKVKSAMEFYEKGYQGAFIAAIKDLLRSQGQ